MWVCAKGSLGDMRCELLCKKLFYRGCGRERQQGHVLGWMYVRGKGCFCNLLFAVGGLHVGVWATVRVPDVRSWGWVSKRSAQKRFSG